jgi:hypothetical protein
LNLNPWEPIRGLFAQRRVPLDADLSRMRINASLSHDSMDFSEALASFASRHRRPRQPTNQEA